MAGEAVLGVELVTPEVALFAGEATAVITATSEGDLTILAGHTAIVGDIVSSVVRIELPDGTTERFAVHGGFMQVATGTGAAAGLLDSSTDGDRTTRVTLLAGIAEHVASIDLARAQAAREVAQAHLASTAGREDDEDDRLSREQAEASLVRATLRIEAAAEAASGRVGA
jgi:F-type H+-transporting ATPase subunit epsilon